MNAFIIIRIKLMGGLLLRIYYCCLPIYQFIKTQHSILLKISISFQKNFFIDIIKKEID